MFCVIFEVQPRPDQWDAYLGLAKRLRPELERMDGFVDNVRSCATPPRPARCPRSGSM